MNINTGAVESLQQPASLDPDCSVATDPTPGFWYRIGVQPIQEVPGPGSPVDKFIITVEWDSISSKGGIDSVRLIYGI